MRNSVRFCAIVVVISVSGCGGGLVLPKGTVEHGKRVTLDVKKVSSDYVCTFSGGDGGNGDLVISEKGQVNAHLDLQGAGNFTIQAIYFSDDSDPPQLSYKLTDHNTKAVIHDNHTDTSLKAYYGVIVEDATANAKFVCDPKIVNN